MANMATSLLGTTESVPGASIPVEFVQQPSESYRSAPSTPQKSTPQTNTVTIAYTPTPTQSQLQQQQPGATPLNNANLGSSLPQTDLQSLHRGVTDVATSRDATQQQHSVAAMEGGQSASGGVAAIITPTVTNTTDLTQVLSGLQNSGELTSVLQQQPHLVEDLSAIATGEVSMDPENLRFQYDIMEEAEPAPPKTSKRGKPQVYREQDRFLPIHNVARIMRNAIPRNGKVSKDAKECMQECVSEFISFITSEASDKCIAEKRKTITGDDILVAMATLGFDNYIEPLKLYLQKYREFTKADKISGNGSTATASTGAIATGQSGLTGGGGRGGGGGGGQVMGQIQQPQVQLQQSGVGGASAPPTGTATVQQVTTNSNSYTADRLQLLSTNPT